MKPTVILNRCADYDAQRIEELVFNGLERLDLNPRGRTLVKPNCVTSGPYFPHAHTRVEFLEGVLRAIERRAPEPLDELAVGERCGITVPTRFAYNGADYYSLRKRIKGLKFYHFEECPQVEIPLYHDGRLRDSIFTPEPVAQADFFVNCPKFKAHPWTTVTFSMKNYIGIQDDRHRLLDHDHRLNEKVSDLQYIVQPQFIVTDGIIAGEGRMLTPTPFDLGLVAMGNNQAAFDSVCCHIIGVDPMSVEHIRLAYENGFGPVDLSEIDIVGDLSLDEAKERGQGFEVGLIRVQDYFEGSKIRAYGGRPPSDGGHDYCWGGCPGALEEAIEIMRLYDQQTDGKLPPMHVVFGEYDKPIQPGPGEKIIFIGDCAKYSGQLGDQLIQLESVYVDRSQKRPLDAETDDIFMKMWSVRRQMAKLKNQDYIRIAGCPVSVAEQTLILVQLGGLKSPYFDPKQVVPFVSAYLSSRTRTAFSRLFGIKYNQPGPMLRGRARPKLNLPPPGVPTPLEIKSLPSKG